MCFWIVTTRNVDRAAIVAINLQHETRPSDKSNPGRYAAAIEIGGDRRRRQIVVTERDALVVSADVIDPHLGLDDNFLGMVQPAAKRGVRDAAIIEPIELAAELASTTIPAFCVFVRPNLLETMFPFSTNILWPPKASTISEFGAGLSGGGSNVPGAGRTMSLSRKRSKRVPVPMLNDSGDLPGPGPTPHSPEIGEPRR